MNKLYLLIISSVLAATLLNCSSMGNPKKAVCKQGCQSSYDSCKSDTKGDSAKLLKCEAEKAACLKGCDEM